MKKLLKKKYNIIGAVLAFREGELIKYCLDDLLKYCNEVVVVLDNYDKKTEKIVLEYKKRFPEKMYIRYSNVDKTDSNEEKNVGLLKSRLNTKQQQIREEVLLEVKKINDIRKIDLLVWPDADECFTDFVTEDLMDFLRSDKKIMAIRPVTVYDSFNIARDRTLIPHGKIFKYRKDMTTKGYRGRGFYMPFLSSDVFVSYYTLVHYPLLTKESREFRKHYIGDRSDKSQHYNLYDLEADVRRLSPRYLKKLLHNGKPMCTVKEYEEKRISHRS